MSTTIIFSEFRDNLTNYLNLMKEKGEKLIIKDGRTGKTIIKIKNSDSADFDWEKHIKKIKKLGGKKNFVSDEKDRKKFRNSFDKWKTL